ncbi:helix-turn-helix transcriptional regulator [Micromonospora sp. WMMD712]|uniref:helix-turn-helix transcriptional regulator n=1 Tax=Micromonospora sp. WMMD712 TaxID=3016096 RepID=UPI00249BCE97|nr:helix-turn-helix transcriptional regulator [Micromonospora sp. WMMD712]WFE56888.1 helix-turn-helix transcriptional regulator [Micromonospora sp. WMMD712]
MSRETPLGDFLRARREALKPHEVGLPEYGRRRVPGLRREEVALLAGVSADYYIRLEQGRETSPSPQVVTAVAAALRLDAEATDHLHRLCLDETQRPRHHRGDDVGGSLRQLVEGWASPAFVVGPALDVLAANSMATALHSGFARFDNLARMVFVDPAGRDFYRHWERAAHSCVAEMRAAYGFDPASVRIAEVVEELSQASDDFARLWRLHEVRGKSQERKHLRHPQVGDLHIDLSAFTVNTAPDQQLVVYQAEPASPTAAALERLRELTPARTAATPLA